MAASVLPSFRHSTGELEAGAILVPGDLKWEREDGSTADESIVTNLLPIYWWQVPRLKHGGRCAEVLLNEKGPLLGPPKRLCGGLSHAFSRHELPTHELAPYVTSSGLSFNKA